MRKTKTDIPKFRTFGVRVIESFIDELSKKDFSIDLPSRSYNIDQETIAEDLQKVCLKLKCPNGNSVEATMIVTIIDQQLVVNHVASDFFSGYCRDAYDCRAKEDTAGVISISDIRFVGRDVIW